MKKLIVLAGLSPLLLALGSPDPEPERVQPGDVAWHADLEAAQAAAAESGRPILLFQLLGKLDEEFC